MDFTEAERLMNEWKAAEARIVVIKARLAKILGVAAPVPAQRQDEKADEAKRAGGKRVAGEGMVAEGTVGRSILEALLNVGGDGSRATIGMATPNPKARPMDAHIKNVGSLLLHLASGGYVEPSPMGWRITDKGRLALGVGVQEPLPAEEKKAEPEDAGGHRPRRSLPKEVGA